MSDGGSSPPTDQVSQTDAPAVGSENNATQAQRRRKKRSHRLLLQTMTKMKVKVKKLKEEKSLTETRRKIRTTFPINLKKPASL